MGVIISEMFETWLKIKYVVEDAFGQPAAVFRRGGVWVIVLDRYTDTDGIMAATDWAEKFSRAGLRIQRVDKDDEYVVIEVIA